MKEVGALNSSTECLPVTFHSFLARAEKVLGRRRLLVVILVLSSVYLVRLGFYAVYGHNYDMQNLFTWDHWGVISKNLADGYGISDNKLMTYYTVSDQLSPTATRSPLPLFFYAAIFKVFGVKLLPMLLVQWLFDVGASVFIYLTAMRLFRSRLVAAFGVLMYALYPALLPYSIGFASEPMFGMFFAMACYCMVRVVEDTSSLKCWALAGAMFGCAALCRPAILPLPVLLGGILFLQHRFKVVAGGMAMATALALVMVPWGVRNDVAMHKFILTSTLSGYNLYGFNQHIERDHYLRHVLTPERDAAIEWLVARNGKTFRDFTEVQFDQFLRTEAKRIIKAHPFRFVWLSICRSIWLWDPRVGHYQSEIIPMALTTINWILLGLAAAACRYLGMLRYKGAWILVVSALFFVAVHTPFSAQFRYVVPVFPMVLMMASYAITQIADRLPFLRRSPAREAIPA